MNKIILTGRLVRDPELRATATGTEVCNFTIAVDRRFTPKGEEKQADFIDCTAWGKSGVFVNTYFHKGDGITLDGRMESRKWVDKEGGNRVSWGVTVDNVEFPLGKGKGATDSSDSDSSLPFTLGDNGGDFEEIEDIPDTDLPF